MWQFMASNPVLAAIIVVAAIFTAGVLAVIIYKNGIKLKNGTFEVSVGNNVSKKKKNRPNSEEAELLRTTLILSNLINQWQNQLDKKIDSKKRECISTSIRYGNDAVDNNINLARLEYRNYLKEVKNINQEQQLTQEDAYQDTIYGFLIEQVRDKIKDTICTAIREDHFDKKTDAEISSIAENCTKKYQYIFDSNIEHLNKEVIEKVKETEIPKIKKIANDIIENAIDKYKSLEREITETISNEENTFKESLRVKFPGLSSGIDDLVNYRC